MLKDKYASQAVRGKSIGTRRAGVAIVKRERRRIMNHVKELPEPPSTPSPTAPWSTGRFHLAQQYVVEPSWPFTLCGSAVYTGPISQVLTEAVGAKLTRCTGMD